MTDEGWVLGEDEAWRVCPNCEVWWLRVATPFCWLCGSTGTVAARPGMENGYNGLRQTRDDPIGGWRLSSS